MELFNKEGHLTDEGLRAVVDGTLDEMGRLEASEHLSFCDSCLVRYTELLADDTLLVPETPLTPTVLARVRRRAVRIRHPFSVRSRFSRARLLLRRAASRPIRPRPRPSWRRWG